MIRGQVGDKVRIIEMNGEPEYKGKTGVIELIDAAGQLHGTWGGCAIIPDVDKYEIVND